MRLYGLKSRAAYDTADFFALYEKDGQTLGGDLVFKEEFQLLPNESKTLDKQLAPEVLYLGLFAAFRDLERSEWRRVATFVPHQANNLQVLLEQAHFDRSNVALGKATCDANGNFEIKQEKPF